MTAPLIRPATEADLTAIVALLADDELGATREDPADPAPYQAAFRAIVGDPNQHLVVAVTDGTVIGTMQLSIVPGLSRKGTSRALIEAVRVRRDWRGGGLGGTLMVWAIEQARDLGCGLVQLASDMTRGDAHRFYERLGFVRSHYGFKYQL